MKKQDVQQVVDTLPDEGEIDVDKLLYTLWLRRKVELSLAQADAGDLIPQEVVEREMDEWLA